MKSFVIAVYDTFEGELELKCIDAESPEDALVSVLGLTRESLPMDTEYEVESLIDYSYSCDMPLAIIEVQK